MLKYGEIYDLIISTKNYKGIYLGEKITRGKSGLTDIILTTKPTMLYNYSLFRFKKFRFEDNKLIMGGCYNINIPERQRFFYEELLKEKFGVAGRKNKN